MTLRLYLYFHREKQRKIIGTMILGLMRQIYNYLRLLKIMIKQETAHQSYKRETKIKNEEDLYTGIISVISSRFEVIKK